MGLPRSGTTLLQRVLASHSEVASIAEPWVLLPLISCFDEKITASTFGHKELKHALTDFNLEFPEFQSRYYEHVRIFITQIYEKLSGKKKYFLDKTPRYYLIAEELHQVFPEAKFIYLFRNPIDVFDSAIDMFCSGRLYRVPFIYVDMMHGLNQLSVPIGQRKESIYAIKYEDFCADGEFLLQQICKYLQIDYQSEMLINFNKVHFFGKMGDPKRYQSNGIISQRTKNKKPLSIVRRLFYKKWINNIKTISWEVSGYSKDEVLLQLYSRPNSSLIKQFDDLTGFIVCNIVLLLGYKLSSKLKKWQIKSDELNPFPY